MQDTTPTENLKYDLFNLHFNIKKMNKKVGFKNKDISI